LEHENTNEGTENSLNVESPELGSDQTGQRSDSETKKIVSEIQSLSLSA